MFTGIIETMSRVEKITRDRTNVHFEFSSHIASELKVDQSLAHNGVCLTVIKVEGNRYTVTAIEETLKRSNLGELKIGDEVNIERCMPANGRFDGHIVQGHVDATAVCKKVKDMDGSWEFEFEYDASIKDITVEKGSVTVNGVSLTVVKSGKSIFSVHIIPYTFNHTNFKTIVPGRIVNIEFDVIGKYVRKILNL